VIALIDGEHHPSAVRDSLARLDRERGLAGVIFCGGEEKVRPEVLDDPAAHYGFPLARGESDPGAELERLASETDADSVVDLADEPVLTPAGKLELAALALHLGLAYELPGTRLVPPGYERIAFAGPKLAVIGTGKRTGKTAVAGQWAALLRRRGGAPVIVSMGRGGPAEPQLAQADTSLADLRAIAADGRHAASDYLEDAALAGVPTVGCRRVGGGLVGEPFESNVVEGAALAATLDPDALIFEGSGSCIPPVEVDSTVCVVGQGADPLHGLASYALMRSRLALTMGGDRELASAIGERFCRALACELVPEPVEPPPAGARVALFSTSDARPPDLEPIVASSALARRAELEADLDRAAAERCDVYLVELKAAAIDTVAVRAEREGARVVFVRNRAIALDADLDTELLNLHDHA
jgi:cyclic 2,3-diphosphoglycerate synthase